MAPDPYIRFRDPDDKGLRPPDANMFTTPAIAILKPPGMGLDTDPAIAYADIEQLVHVEVGNRGMTPVTDDAAATVTVWAFGFGTLSGYAGSLGGVTGKSAPVAIPAGASGNATFVNIAWTPQGAEIGGTSRHFCIRANVFVDLADQEPPPGSPAGTAPTITPFTEIRHAQRNMTLLPKPVTLKKPLIFELAIANPDEHKEQEFKFEVREVRGKFGRNEIAHLRRTRWIDHERKEQLALPGTDGKVEVAPARHPARQVALEFRKKHGHELDVRLKPGAESTVTLQMGIEPGDPAAVHRFDVFQHGRKGLIGGARVMTIAVPEELLERAPESEAY